MSVVLVITFSSLLEHIGSRQDFGVARPRLPKRTNKTALLEVQEKLKRQLRKACHIFLLENIVSYKHGTKYVFTKLTKLYVRVSSVHSQFTILEPKRKFLPDGATETRHRFRSLKFRMLFDALDYGIEKYQTERVPEPTFLQLVLAMDQKEAKRAGATGLPTVKPRGLSSAPF